MGENEMILSLSYRESLWPYIMERKHSNAAVNRAGDFLSSRDKSSLTLFESGIEEWEKRLDEAFDILAEWRDIHALPLKAVSTLLASEASGVEGSSPIVADRLKRYRSIRSKLRRYPVTNLTTIQDIAGCRAVVQEVSHAYELRERLLFRLLSEADGPQIVEKWSRDYIANPKADGYRSIHEVAKFFSPNPDISQCNELRVEIQIRSTMQHAWAMAVETASAVTNQALKSGVGEELWKRFFFLVGEIIASVEGTANSLASGTAFADARREAAALAGQLRVINLLSNMQHVLEGYSTFEGGKGESDLYLLELDSQKREINYMGYKKEDFKQASSAYSEAEREHQNKEDIHVVLVSVESLNDLKSAYPSFFLDSTGFIDLIREQLFG
jgi:ppGpp synthetase/RelA/SpoT-type nucleotidyltranferase